MSSAIHNLNTQNAGANLIAGFGLQRTNFGFTSRDRFSGNHSEMKFDLIKVANKF